MSSVITRVAIAPVLAGPSVHAEQVTQLALGESAAIMERTGDWRRVCTHTDGYNGWIHAGYLLEAEDPQAQEWLARATGWSDGAVLRVGDRGLAVPLRARVLLREDGVVLPDGRHAVVTSGRIRKLDEVTASARTQAPERWALEHFDGSPYQWGGITPWGVDCSGLVQTTFAARGVALPRDSSQQAACGESIPLQAIQPGDLLFFRGESGDGITHVAFAGDSHTLIHATLACGSMLAEPWVAGTRAASLHERLVAARRLEHR